MPAPREQPNPPRRRRQESAGGGGWLWLLLLLGLAVIMWVAFFPGAGVIEYSEFIDLAKKGQFAKVSIIGKTRALGEFKPGFAEKQEKPIASKIKSNRIQTQIPDSD